MYRVSCPYCGEPTDTFPDPSTDAEQDYIEDCAVCCRPIHFVVSWSELDGAHRVEAEPV